MIDRLLQLLRRIPFYLRRSQYEAELRDELDFHRQLRVDELRHQGLPQHEANRQARLALGNQAVIQEAARDVWMVRWVDTLRRDLTVAVRSGERPQPFAQHTGSRDVIGMTSREQTERGTGESPDDVDLVAWSKVAEQCASRANEQGFAKKSANPCGSDRDARETAEEAHFKLAPDVLRVPQGMSNRSHCGRVQRFVAADGGNLAEPECHPGCALVEVRTKRSPSLLGPAVFIGKNRRREPVQRSSCQTAPSAILRATETATSSGEVVRLRRDETATRNPSLRSAEPEFR